MQTRGGPVVGNDPEYSLVLRLSRIRRGRGLLAQREARKDSENSPEQNAATERHVFSRARDVPSSLDQQISNLAGYWRAVAGSKRRQTAALETNWRDNLLHQLLRASSIELADGARREPLALRCEAKKGACDERDNSAHAPETLMRVAVVIDVAGGMSF